MKYTICKMKNTLILINIRSDTVHIHKSTAVLNPRSS